MSKVDAVIMRQSGFNPTLVRLRPGRIHVDIYTILEFQSHAGSIEAPEFRLGIFGLVLFQSHAGSIEATSALGVFRVPAPVSIPRWFD